MPHKYAPLRSRRRPLLLMYLLPLHTRLKPHCRSANVCGRLARRWPHQPHKHTHPKCYHLDAKPRPQAESPTRSVAQTLRARCQRARLGSSSSLHHRFDQQCPGARGAAGAPGTCRCPRHLPMLWAPADARTPWGLWARGGPQGRSGSQRGWFGGGQGPPVSNQPLLHSSVVRTRSGGEQKENIILHQKHNSYRGGKSIRIGAVVNNSSSRFLFEQQQAVRRPTTSLSGESLFL